MRTAHLADILALGMTTGFPAAAREALQDTQLRRNLGIATTHDPRQARAGAVAELPDWEELRDAGAALKRRVLRHLDEYLLEFEAAVERAGGHVHWARDAAEAGAIVSELVRGDRRARGRQGQVADDGRDRAQRGARAARASTSSRPISPS